MAKIHGKKNTSKRKSLSLQHKIARKSNEKKRKIRSEARKATKAGIKIKRKKPTLKIPSLWPFKQEELLLQKQRQDQKDADREKHKQLNAQKKQQLAKEKRKKEATAPSRPVYGLGPVIENSDLLIEVIDARDPLATRCVGLEQLPNKPHKIIVVTKGDLIPRAQLKEWLIYLRNKTGQPVVSLVKRSYAEDAGKKASVANSVNKKPLKPLGFKNMVKVMQAFNAARNIAILGYPLVGKHTVESYLKSPQMNLSKKAKMQCASIVEKNEIEDHPDLLFTQKPQASNLPLLTLKRLFERCEDTKKMQIKLALPDYADTRELLQKVQKERHLPGPNDAARSLLKIWNQYRYFTRVPKGDNMSPEPNVTELRCQSLTQNDLSALYAEEFKELDSPEVVAGWGRAEPTLGMLVGSTSTIPNTMKTGSSAMETDGGEKMSEEDYFELKLPVSTSDLQTIKVGGPEPFFLTAGGSSSSKTNADKKSEETKADDEDMSSEEEEEEEDEEEEDDEDMEE